MRPRSLSRGKQDLVVVDFDKYDEVQTIERQPMTDSVDKKLRAARFSCAAEIENAASPVVI